MAYNNYGFTPYSRDNERMGRGYSSAYFAKRQNNFSGFSVSRPGAYNGKRRSSCRKIEKGSVVYLTGWKNGRKAGFRSFFVAPAANPKTKVSGSGKTWVSCRVIVENKTHGSQGMFAGWWHKETSRVFCKQLGLMLNPNTGFISYLPRKGQTFQRR